MLKIFLCENILHQKFRRNSLHVATKIFNINALMIIILYEEHAHLGGLKCRKAASTDSPLYCMYFPYSTTDSLLSSNFNLCTKHLQYSRKYFCVLNFHNCLGLQKNFRYENFPNYGTLFLFIFGTLSSTCQCRYMYVVRKVWIHTLYNDPWIAQCERRKSWICTNHGLA